jgi:hypothetical protein
MDLEGWNRAGEGSGQKVKGGGNNQRTQGHGPGRVPA